MLSWESDVQPEPFFLKPRVLVVSDRSSSGRPSMALILGVDEAGRGSVVGPMVICGVEIPRSDGRILADLGVRDSKLISPKRREELSSAIRQHALRVILREVEPTEIDRAVVKNHLNRLEAEVMAEIVAESASETVYLDAPQVNTSSYASMVTARLPDSPVIIAENKADINYPVVGAASILAKVRRDERILELHETYGNFGSGYPGDAATVRFLQRFYGNHGRFPSAVRTSWTTVRRLIAKHRQREVSDYT